MSAIGVQASYLHGRAPVCFCSTLKALSLRERRAPGRSAVAMASAGCKYSEVSASHRIAGQPLQQTIHTTLGYTPRCLFHIKRLFLGMGRTANKQVCELIAASADPTCAYHGGQEMKTAERDLWMELLYNNGVSSRQHSNGAFSPLILLSTGRTTPARASTPTCPPSHQLQLVCIVYSSLPANAFTAPSATASENCPER